MITCSLTNLSRAVCVNKGRKASVVEMGVEPEKIGICLGFLSSLGSELYKNTRSDSVWRFCEGRITILAANGKVGLQLCENIYRLDVVGLICQLKPDYPEIGPLVCFWSHLQEGGAYLGQIIRLTDKFGISENISFNTEAGNLLPVSKACDLFLGPANVDFTM